MSQYPPPQGNTGYPQWQQPPSQQGQPHADQHWQPPSQDLPSQEQWQQPSYPPRPEPYYPPQQPPSQPLPNFQQWQQQPPPPFQQYAQIYQPQVIINQPKKSRIGRIFGIGCGSLVALIVLFAVIGAISNHGSTATTPAAQSTASGGSSPTSQSTSNGQTTHNLGETITAGTWQVTVHSVKTTKDPGNQFVTLKAGHVFLVVDATLKNLDSSPQTASTLIQWTLRDAAGNTYDQEFGFGSGSTGPEGTIAPNQLAHGQFAYQVPTNVHQFTLQFQPGLGGSDLVQWNVTV